MLVFCDIYDDLGRRRGRVSESERPSGLGRWISNMPGVPWFKSSTLQLAGFVLGSPEFMTLRLRYENSRLHG